MWHVLDHREMRRRARLRAPAEPGPRPRPDRPAGSDLLPQIRHIVVLMMENHSYDNYLGMLPGRGEGFPLGPDGRPEVSNTGRDGEVIRAFLDEPMAAGWSEEEARTANVHELAGSPRWRRLGHDDSKLASGLIGRAGTAAQDASSGQDTEPTP